MQCLYVARNMAKCPLTRGACLREVSISGGSTVIQNQRLGQYNKIFHNSHKIRWLLVTHFVLERREVKLV